MFKKKKIFHENSGGTGPLICHSELNQWLLAKFALPLSAVTALVSSKGFSLDSLTIIILCHLDSSFDCFVLLLFKNDLRFVKSN